VITAEFAWFGSAERNSTGRHRRGNESPSLTEGSLLSWDQGMAPRRVLGALAIRRACAGLGVLDKTTLPEDLAGDPTTIAMAKSSGGWAPPNLTLGLVTGAPRLSKRAVDPGRRVHRLPGLGTQPPTVSRGRCGKLIGKEERFSVARFVGAAVSFPCSRRGPRSLRGRR